VSPDRVSAAALAAVLSIVLSAAPLTAQEPPEPQTSPPGGGASSSGAPAPGLRWQEEIVVTANRVPAAAESVGSSVTVIGRQEIEQRREPFVLDLLRTVPGLEISQSGGPGTVASAFLRGADSNHTLVLLDGIPVNSTTSGGFDLSLLRSDDVERIEVLRGPQSTLYGSEAIGGVISIVTRRGSPGLHADLDGRAGSRNGRGLTASVDGGNAGGGFDYSVSATGQRTDGAAGAAPAHPYSDSGEAARLGVALPGAGRLDLTLRHSAAATNLDGFLFGVGPVAAPNFFQHRQLSLGSLQLVQPLTRAWNLRVNAGAGDEKTRGEDPDDPFNNYDFRSRHVELGVQSDLKLGRDDTLIAGLSTERRSGENVGAYRESLTLSSLYVQDDWSLHDRLFLTAGVRDDHSSRFGDKATYRLTGSLLWPGAWRLHGSYGTGFRGPSFDELFYPFAGNPSLRPETSEGADLGLERELYIFNSSDRLVAGVTLFANRFNDLIGFDFVSSTFTNVRLARAQGAEASLRLKPRQGLEIQASYTRTATEDLATGLPLARRPRDRWAFLAAFAPGARWRGTLSLAAVDHRIDSDGLPLDPYQRVDLSLEYRARSWCAPYLLIQNLLDQRYAEVRGYPAPRLWAFLGLRLRRS